MKPTIKGILIDPFAQTIAHHTYERGIEGIYAAIGADCFCTIRLPYDHVAYLDDEGLYRENQRFWSIGPFQQPLAGKALIVRITNGGEDADCTLNLAVLKRAIQWRPNIELEGFTKPTEHTDPDTGMVHINLGEAKFKPREE